MTMVIKKQRTSFAIKPWLFKIKKLLLIICVNVKRNQNNKINNKIIKDRQRNEDNHVFV
jgi:hypothetical protein